MKTTIRKWENRLEESTTGKLVIAQEEPEITLEALVGRITDENCHDEIRIGPLVGNEAS